MSRRCFHFVFAVVLTVGLIADPTAAYATSAAINTESAAIRPVPAEASRPNDDALLPQRHAYQVTLYDWLETLTVEDVTLPDGNITWDGTYEDVDHLADLWLQLDGASASRVVRGAPEYYVLDDGQGGGIEGAGTVRILHTTGYGENKAWENEIAHLYQLDLPLADGEQGNPYYQHQAVANRALVVMAVDMMMYDEVLSTPGGGGLKWYDMYGKAFLSWVQVYEWCKEAAPPHVREALLDGLSRFVSRMTWDRPRDANTNMDMFSAHGLARLYMATADSTVRADALAAFKRNVFGYNDGVLGTHHDTDNGTFFPAGYVGENDGPDAYYNGESFYHMVGALTAVTDRETGEVDTEWTFLEEIVRRMSRWRTMQIVWDPAYWSGHGQRLERLYTSGTGYSNRTSGSVVKGQAPELWRDISAASSVAEARPLVFMPDKERLKGEGGMISDINNKVGDLQSHYNDEWTGTVPEWNGWESWVKETPYLPPEGWYSTLMALHDADDPSIKLPMDGDGHSTALGGPPTGPEFWSYKGSDGTRDFGFFVEADQNQGTYKGWYGGKLESFWTPETGTVILNRHSKAGDEPRFEDSSDWSRLPFYGAHHVWGYLVDDAGEEVGFSTTQIRDREHGRTVTWDDPDSPMWVEVENDFSNPQDLDDTGLQDDRRDVLNGALTITNRFDAVADGVQITHTVQSDQADAATALYVGLPIYMRAVSYNRFGSLTRGNHPQIGLDDTTIDYWDGNQWRELPDAPDYEWPTAVTTTALRLGRDFRTGEGPQYAYVDFESPTSLRRSPFYQHDVYQTKTRIRTIQMDLHGNPGTAQPLPASRSVTYTVQTTDPTAEDTSSGDVHQIVLQKGWNIVSSRVSPDPADLDALFGELVPDVALVRDQSGNEYDPIAGTDEIGYWEEGKAYAVFATSTTALRIAGAAIDPDGRSIDLEAGWNWVPYFGPARMPVTQALASVQDHLVIVKDGQGRVYYPELDIEDLVDMVPGEGYKIFVNTATTLTYPSP